MVARGVAAWVISAAVGSQPGQHCDLLLTEALTKGHEKICYYKGGKKKRGGDGDGDGDPPLIESSDICSFSFHIVFTPRVCS